MTTSLTDGYNRIFTEICMPIVVVPHDPDWLKQAADESAQISAALGDNIRAIHHIGSTAIPEIFAKPILDLLLVVNSITTLDQDTQIMEGLGYEAKGEYGIPGRRYFRKSNEKGTRTHHVHSFENDSEQVHRHLIFRDYMIGNPDAAKAYGKLKVELASAHPDDIEAYMDGKDLFIKEHLALAEVWSANQIRSMDAAGNPAFG